MTPDLPTFLAAVALDTIISELGAHIRALETALIKRAELTGDSAYLGFRVTQADGKMTVTAHKDAIAKLQPPPRVPIAIPPIVTRDPIATLTGTMERFEDARKHADKLEVEGIS